MCTLDHSLESAVTAMDHTCIRVIYNPASARHYFIYLSPWLVHQVTGTYHPLTDSQTQASDEMRVEDTNNHRHVVKMQSCAAEYYCHIHHAEQAWK
jgi:hypothetical protein